MKITVHLVGLFTIHVSPQNKRAKPLVSAYDDTDKLGIEDDMDFYEDPNNKKKDSRAPGGGYGGGKFLCSFYTDVK